MTQRLLPFFLLLLGTAFPTLAQTPGPPRFLVEEILVEGTRRDAVREIVAAESLLRPGREYSEQELREAVYRVKRLPFVVDAEHSLRPGGEQGRYQLVITVEETHLGFYSIDYAGFYDGDDRNVQPGEDRVSWGGSATAGGRWFLGSQGLLFGSVLGFEDEGPVSAQAGYTRYNLFGHGGFGSIALSANLDEDRGDAYQVSFSMGLPIVGNHSLRADLAWGEAKDEFFETSFRREERRLGLAWIYDTTDDPLFPTSGTRVTGDAGYSREEDEFDRSSFFPDAKTSFDSWSLGLVGRRHWALTHRQSVSTEAGASWSESDDSGDFGTFEQWTTGVALGHSMDLWGFEKTERFGDFRWENRVDVFRNHFDSIFSSGTSIDGRLTTSLVFRNAWGLIRVSFIYVDNLQRDFRTEQEFP